MPRLELAQGFNKEKFALMLAALVVAAGVYIFVVTSPLVLEAARPISSDAGPQKERDVIPPAPESEDYYVVDGRITSLTDKFTGKLVNRQRKTPFMPAADFLAARPTELPKPKGGTANVPLPPPPPPPPPLAADKDKDKKRDKREFGPSDAESLVEFVGVITMRGVTYGMLRPKDGASMFRVKVGDRLPGLDYTVQEIEKQAITVADADGHIFLLRDLRYTDNGLAADTSAPDSKANVADSADPKGKDKPKQHDKGGKKAPDKGPPAPKAGPPGPGPGPGPGPQQPPAGAANKLAEKLQNLDPKLLEKLKAKLQGKGN